MNHPVIAGFAIALISGQTPALAQSLTAEDWAGHYYGVTLGYASGDSSHINNRADTGGPDISGGSFGLTLGANFAAPSGAFVYGFEADLSYMNVSGELPVGSYNGFSCGTGPCQTDVSQLATLRGRIGVPRGATLLYGTAGLAIAGVDGTIPGDPALDIGTQTATGWTAGIGAEYRLNERMNIKAEILHTDLGDTQYDNGVTYSAPFLVDTKFTQFRVGVNVRF